MSGIRRPFEQDENGDWYSVDMRELRNSIVMAENFAPIPHRQGVDRTMLEKLIEPLVLESPLLDPSKLYVVDPAMLRVKFPWRISMEDQVRLFDESEVIGIKEVMAPLAVMPADLLKVPEIILPEKKHIYFEGETVFASADALYIRESVYDWQQIAQRTYDRNQYQKDRKDIKEAVASEYGLTNIPVFCLNSGDLAVFNSIRDQIDIQLRGPLKYIAFFTGKTNDSAYPHGPAIAVILYDGSTIRYVAQNTNEGHIGLASPIREKPEEVFANIMRFLSRSVRGIKILLRNERERLFEIGARRSEDMFTYLQGVTPDPAQTAIHGELLNILERNYTNDAIEVQDRERLIEAHQRTINGAKSQMPSGKKGKALRESYLKSPVLTELLDWFEIWRNGNTMTLTFYFKQDLVLQASDGGSEDDEEKEYEIDYGRPVITITMTSERANTRDASYISKVTGTSRDLKVFMHPHLDGTRSWCLGTYITPLSHAILGGNIPMATTLIWEYLNNFNENSPLVQIDACADNMHLAQKRDLIVRRR